MPVSQLPRIWGKLRPGTKTSFSHKNKRLKPKKKEAMCCCFVVASEGSIRGKERQCLDSSLLTTDMKLDASRGGITWGFARHAVLGPTPDLLN